LVRVYRYQIKDFLVKKNKTSYLWRKYCFLKNRNDYKFEVFPGAEHCCDEKVAPILYHVYQNLDKKLNTTFVNKLERVLNARGIFYVHEQEQE